MLCSFRLYYIQFKEVKILWGPGTGYKGREPKVGQNKHPIKDNKIFLFYKRRQIFVFVKVDAVNILLK